MAGRSVPAVCQRERAGYLASRAYERHCCHEGTERRNPDDRAAYADQPANLVGLQRRERRRARKCFGSGGGVHVSSSCTCTASARASSTSWHGYEPVSGSLRRKGASSPRCRWANFASRAKSCARISSGRTLANVADVATQRLSRSYTVILLGYASSLAGCAASSSTVGEGK
eukprot:scaffold103052_cov29-Tisochrysis_lutea.AAC.1